MLEYERGAGLIRAGVTAEGVERLIAPKLTEMRQRVPWLTVRVPQDTNSPSVQIDGVPVRAELLSAAIPLDPGSHTVVVFAPGRRAAHIQGTLGEGASVTQAVELVPDNPSIGTISLSHDST